ncbi:U11/U12 small nuclear ribonucleoprotein 35 kDa protein [Elysia marginata]|uniref:U11/U12 small nuclear ribonucleoprotein 35 kDa protein n=1 Tax=Elysia marginata TaxID=1093978 RepID=A0AAV4HRD1_9GAST|nr:U11/U12 small nuclear ribonucleoprotein 35 kDa protein [Elysia marginata]
MEPFSPVFVERYDPLKAGSIDGTDDYPHDKGIIRALQAKFKPNKFVQGNPECTVFVGRLGPNTTEETVVKSMKEFGDIVNAKLVTDVVTGFSKCYCFVEYEETYQARNAVRNGHKMAIEDHEVLVEQEKGRLLKGWIPRRLGGGLGGKRESGQLRFGGKDRPFRRPIIQQNASTGSQGQGSAIDRRQRSMSRERRRSRSRERAERHKHRSSERYRDRGYHKRR